MEPHSKEALFVNFLFLTFVVSAILFQSVAKKQYNTKTEKRGPFLFNSVSVIFAAVFFFLSDTDGFHLSPNVIPYILGFAVSYGTAAICSFMALREGALSLTSLVTSYSLMIPTLYGLLFLQEKANAVLIIGLILLCISLFLVNTKKGETRITLRWGLWVFFAFLGNGFCSVVQTAQQTAFQGQFKSEFMIGALSLLSVFFLFCSFCFEKNTQTVCLKKGSHWMILNGLANGAVNLLVMILVGRMPTSVMFPIISGGGIILATAFSFFFYKEKLTFKQYLGVLFGTGSVILMNL